MDKHLWRAWWPLRPEARAMSLHELIAEATEALPNVAAAGRVTLVSRPRWRLAPGRDYPGTGGASEILVCDAWVRRVPRTVDSRWAQDVDPSQWEEAA